MPSQKPNILFFHVDNLGMGELGCYGGGILRGADTKRMDNFAKQGVKLTHYVVEPQCTPTRSALMTGRFPIRSGNHTIALGGNGGGNGEWGDCLLMLDHDFGVLLDKLDELGVADNTIVVMCGDNGAEDHLAGRGTGGFFDGSYFSSAEGGIRTPLLIRWPNRIPAGIESNEMVHVTDMFTTLLSMTGCEAPKDRLIDGVDQSDFFLGKKETSNRESCIVWLKDELHAVKWKDFKIN